MRLRSYCTISDLIRSAIIRQKHSLLRSIFKGRFRGDLFYVCMPYDYFNNEKAYTGKPQQRTPDSRFMKEAGNMRKGLTELVFILDRSGSMSGMEKDTIGGFNSLISKQKKEEGKAFISVVLFDDRQEVLYDRVDLEKI